VARRSVSAFNLSFLDIMACGFGAVTLLFLILRHNGDIVQEIPRPDSEIKLLQEDIQFAEAEQARLKKLKQQQQEEIERLQAQIKILAINVDSQEEVIHAQEDPEENLAILKKQVLELENRTAEAEQLEGGDDTRRFIGEGNRQYLTGLHLGGERVLILVDASASMLADNIVNVLRRRNMSEEQQRLSSKWQWTVRTVEWLIAQLPSHSRFQVYVFNTTSQPVLVGTENKWLDAADSLDLERAVEALHQQIPSGGTSLVNAFNGIKSFVDKPDNLFLLTDGLPTQGEKKSRGNKVSGSQRLEFFYDAVKEMPSGITTNIILFPMEGDMQAAGAFWQLAARTNGAYLSPSRDWP
jgi:hypothetical protein